MQGTSLWSGLLWLWVWSYNQRSSLCCVCITFSLIKSWTSAKLFAIKSLIFICQPPSRYFWLMEKMKLKNKKWKTMPVYDKNTTWYDKTKTLYDKTMTQYDKNMTWYDKNMTLSWLIQTYHNLSWNILTPHNKTWLIMTNYDWL